MNKAKTLLGVVLISVIGVGSAFARPSNVPQRHDQSNREVHPLYGGYSEVRDSATGEMVVCSGRCLLAALILNTGPATTRVQIRNSSVADGSGVLVLGDHHFQTINTAPGNNPIALPILLNNGITVQLSAASNGEEVEVEYLDLNP